MKILLVVHKYPPHALGGVEVYTYHLACALRERHQVFVFYRHDDREGPALSEYDQEVDGVFVRRISCRAQGWRASVAGEFLGTFLNRPVEDSLARLIAHVQPDLVHLQHLMSLSVRIPHWMRRSGLPLLITFHDYWFLCANSQLVWPDGQSCRGKAAGMNCVRCAAAARFPSALIPWLRPALAPLFLFRDRMVRQAALQAQRFISPSHFLIDQYTAAGFPKERFIYVENGIPLERLRRSRWQPTDGPLRVTFLGALAWQKGVHILIEAFNGLPEDAARLRIWGDPTIFPEYAGRLRRSVAHPDAHLMGPIANERVGEVLANSDVLVVPSLWYENSPMVIQEARALGVPVVASDLGALAEKVRHEIDGLLFPPGDALALRGALQRLLDEPNLLPRLRSGVPSPGDMSKHALELEGIYRQMLS